MRLLHARQRKMFEFSHNYPPYAILSHTWGLNEITFESFTNCTYDRDSNSYRKIDGCCRQALDDELEYVWIDTCCIDKRNIVELSEAVNSMFRWYRQSQVCYAFLSDVSGEGLDTEEERTALCNSRWFTRGWTLQELLAPSEVVLYNRCWVPLSSKHDLADLLSDITNIPVEYLTATVPLYHASVAQRMSWAAHRETTREEDVAYCLLGIFGINMALLYGEGSSAFLRLQEEILRQTDDQSLLAWGYGLGPDSHYEKWNQDNRADWRSRPVAPRKNLEPLGMLAKHPLAFAGCGHLVRSSRIHSQFYAASLSIPPSVFPLRESTPWMSIAWLKDWLVPSYTGSPMEMTSRGLRFELPLIQYAGQHNIKGVYGLLSCRLEDDTARLIGIPLVSCGNDYARVQCYDVARIPSNPQAAYVRPIPISQKLLFLARWQICHLLRDQEIVVFEQMRLEHQRPSFAIEMDENISFDAVRVTPSNLWMYREGHVQLTREGARSWDTGSDWLESGVSLCCHFRWKGTPDARPPDKLNIIIYYLRPRKPERPPYFNVMITQNGEVESRKDFLLSGILVHISRRIRLTPKGEVYVVRLSLGEGKSELYQIYQDIGETLCDLWHLFQTNGAHSGMTVLNLWQRPNFGLLALPIALVLYSAAFLIVLLTIILGS
ncbi:uncharacterized protein Z520_10544 [Fonsecaea multimorphosa CBS 102226]|uniref:Uncharacterized protein n=1 Tax=Fonsecaea multimorphosa CBS 102226 TaxID=1442371 RepID=A0A0D2KAT7_9EURO|nr:uncharacterized protein Z520_10544 [Fonsecaea multimorphosa CBS 102226]KIX93638.1 hypothetical protein Z520_10544 [Fonsecaea multimorphosa CBS 102226]OAL19752.1 hypothetical protein AYO22_09279 [Fonsecaea multimorphosa]